MPIYWGQSVGGVQAKNFNTEEEDEDYEIQKPHMQSTEDEEQMEDLVINTILIVEQHMTNESMNNNCTSEGCRKHRFEDELSWVLVESIKVFTQSSRVFTQTLHLLTKLVEKSIQSTNVLPQSTNELTQLVDNWTQSMKGVYGE